MSRPEIDNELTEPLCPHCLVPMGVETLLRFCKTFGYCEDCDEVIEL